MMTISKSPNGLDFTAQVVLASGRVVGEGYGPSEETARFYAVYDAIRSADPAARTAGYGHAVCLVDKDAALLKGLAR